MHTCGQLIHTEDVERKNCVAHYMVGLSRVHFSNACKKYSITCTRYVPSNLLSLKYEHVLQVSIGMVCIETTKNAKLKTISIQKEFYCGSMSVAERSTLCSIDRQYYNNIYGITELQLSNLELDHRRQLYSDFTLE